MDFKVMSQVVDGVLLFHTKGLVDKIGVELIAANANNSLSEAELAFSLAYASLAELKPETLKAAIRGSENFRGRNGDIIFKPMSYVRNKIFSETPTVNIPDVQFVMIDHRPGLLERLNSKNLAFALARLSLVSCNYEGEDIFRTISKSAERRLMSLMEKIAPDSSPYNDYRIEVCSPYRKLPTISGHQCVVDFTLFLGTKINDLQSVLDAKVKVAYFTALMDSLDDGTADHHISRILRVNYF